MCTEVEKVREIITFVGMDLSYPLGSLEEMKGVWLGSLSKKRDYVIQGLRHIIIIMPCITWYFLHALQVQDMLVLLSGKNLRQDPIHR